MRVRHTAAACTAAVLSLTLAACGGGDDTASPVPSEEVQEFPADSTMAQFADAGKIKVGTKFDQPLFGLKGLSGDPEGFDVEVAKLVAGKLGIEEDGIEFIESISKNRQDFLKNGTVDFIVATYTINAERDTEVDFAGPVVVAGQGILVKEGNPEGIEAAEDLNGKTVCSQEGSTSAKNITSMFPEATLKLLGGYAECADAMRDGTDGIVAVSTDDLILAGIAANNEGDFEVLDATFTEEPYGIGLPEGQEDFCEFVNEVIADAYENGELQKIFDETIGAVVERELEQPEPYGCDT
ncbi:MAG: glutamate ABC transporter substrate-binding protein [Frankiaceae bacterium]|nr:glutamate ABC transporter substrate-binding protein [Frankiaceae bacterium]